jgi:FAD/FMN-containing dehydrogenase
MPAAMSDYRANREPLVQPGQVDHHVADLSATIAADVPLADVQNLLAQHGQWLPVDGDPHLPVGQLVDTNSSGPLRLGYGHWRDLLLGAQFTNGRGELITAGGRTVKNVAGYDLTKFMVGQRGVFGKLVTITTRAYKRPEAAILARFAPEPARLQRLLPSPQRPQWALLTQDALLCGYMGDERTLAYYSKTVLEWKPRTFERRSLEQDIAHRAALWTGDFRASVPPARVMEFVSAAAPSTWVADAAFGIVLGRSGDAARVKDAASRLSGTVAFGDEKLGPWFDVPAGPQRDLLERLKKSFDPDGVLAPLPWQPRQHETAHA